MVGASLAAALTGTGVRVLLIENVPFGEVRAAEFR